MGPSIYLKRVFIFGLVLLMGLPFTVEGAVERELKINSDPPGAEVYWKRGSREKLLGKTPLTHKFRFHSEISVLRIVVKKKGYKDQVLKVNAKQDHVLAKLEGKMLAADPSIHQLATLSTMQTQLNPILNTTLPSLLEAEGFFDFSLAGPAQVVSTEEGAFLQIFISLGKPKTKVKGNELKKMKVLAKKIWEQFGPSLVLPLASKIRAQAEIKGIVLNSKFSKSGFRFGVNTRMVTRLESRCQATHYTVYNPSTPFGSAAPNMQVITNPCGRIVMVPVTELKIDPVLKVSRGDSTALFLIPFSTIDPADSPETLYEKIGVLLTDEKGKPLLTQGTVPLSLSAPDRSSWPVSKN